MSRISARPRAQAHRDSSQAQVHHAVSLFTNCGAGDIGYAGAGFQFKVMAELDPRRLQVALLNHRSASGIPGDLRGTWTEVVHQYQKSVEEQSPALLAACPPCQGMSSIRSGRGRASDPDAGTQDGRNLLVEVIADTARELRPRIVVVENVPAFFVRKVRHPRTGRAVSAAALLRRRLQNDYACFPFLANLAEYGVPQTRKRAFLTFVRREDEGLQRLRDAEAAPYPRPTRSAEYPLRKPVTVRQALAKLGASSLDAASPDAASDANDALHSVPVWDEDRYAMVAAIPGDAGGSAWETNRCRECGPVPATADSARCPTCSGPLLRPVKKARNGRWRLINGFRSSSYRRMYSDRPAATITTASGHIGSSFTIHPFENRLLSPRECAHLQTLPRSFRWGEALDSWGATNVRAMIGEAVPPLFTRLHGLVLNWVLTGQRKRAPIDASDERCVRAARQMTENR